MKEVVQEDFSRWKPKISSIFSHLKCRISGPIFSALNQNLFLTKSSGDLYADLSLRGSDVEKRVGVKRLGKYGRIAGKHRDLLVVKDHEFKMTPISIVTNFYPNTSPVWVQVESRRELL